MSQSVSENFALRADHASLTCFLNSLLREWHHWELQALPKALKTKLSEHFGIRIQLESVNLWIPVERFSNLGRSVYSGTIQLQDKDDKFRSISFQAMTEALIDFIEVAPGDQSLPKQRFKSRVSDSVRTLEEVLAHRYEDLFGPANELRTFLEAEQFLVIGHSFHPSPKSREGFDAGDRYRYSPEFAGKFALAWFAAAPHIIRQASSEAFGSTDWVKELVASDPFLDFGEDQVPEGFLLYPMHPWQARYLLTLPAIKAHIAARRLISLGESGSDWHPTSSVRSIYRSTAPYMLKTSLNVRLTNSVRSLLLHEVERGVQAHDVFHSPIGQDLLARYPRFKVIYEPAYWGLLDAANQVIDESIVICRCNPFTEATGPQGLVLASLTQDNPFPVRSPIESMIATHQRHHGLSGHATSTLWFQRYLDVVLEPLLMAQADYGILLGAHQQNILIGMNDHLPHLLYFRDCQGTGYSELAYEALKDTIPSLSLANGNILDPIKANTLFIYYLIINATFNVITTIARTRHASEEELLGLLRRKLLLLLDSDPKDKSCILHLLRSETIMHKGNFLCSISDINENTAANPLAIYNAIVNPIAHASLNQEI